jgi:hypothetical protein
MGAVSARYALRTSSGSLAMFAAIRRAVAGCTPGAASIKLGEWTGGKSRLNSTVARSADRIRSKNE